MHDGYDCGRGRWLAFVGGSAGTGGDVEDVFKNTYHE